MKCDLLQKKLKDIEMSCMIERLKLAHALNLAYL